METLTDFDQWLANYQPQPVEYAAVYDSHTGSVISVGPLAVFQEQQFKIVLDAETAVDIISGEISIHHCQVDVHSGNFEIAQLQTLIKLDDVLHRIPDLEFCQVIKPAVYLTHSRRSHSLKIQLSSELGGTKKYANAFNPRKFVWDGATEMNFYISDYNDPNVIYQTVTVTLADLVGKTVTVKNINFGKFSVYTRRLFKNYVMEIQ